MIISESAVNLQSSHSKITLEKEHESLRAWVDGKTESDTDSESQRDAASFQRVVDSVKLSAESLSMAHGQLVVSAGRDSLVPHDASLMKKLKDCARGQCKKGNNDNGTDDVMVADSRLNLMKQLVEVLSGREIVVFDAASLTAEARESDGINTEAHRNDRVEKDSEADLDNNRRGGWGVAYDYSKTVIEQEQTHFSAKGVVRTKDGLEINFTSQLLMERERIEVTLFQLRAGDAQLVDPLVLNFNGNAAELTEDKINFDLNSDGVDENISFVAGGSGFLVLDKNGDGIVNNGSELFGPSTGDGFAELATHDDDKNGWIDEADAVYDNLRIWQGSPSKPHLSDLRSSNVGAIYLGSAITPFENHDSNGTLLGQTVGTGVFLLETGQVGTVQQIDLVS